MSWKLKSIPLLHLASAGDSEDSFGETFSVAGLISEAYFAPLNGGPDSPFRCIVGWLDTLNAQKGEKNVPVFEKTGGACPDIFVGAVPVAQA